MTNAVILPPTAASFQRVAGLPVLQRTVRAALRCCERVIVLAGEHAGLLNELLAGSQTSTEASSLQKSPEKA